MGRLTRALVDTSPLLRTTPNLRSYGPGWAMSVVTVGELEAGVLLAHDPSVRAFRLGRLTQYVAEALVLPVNRAVSGCYAELRAATGRRPSNDLWIAATALAHGLRLVTADKRQAALPLVDAVYVGDDAEET